MPDGLAHADFSASSPYGLAVGGEDDPSNTALLPDIVWFEGNGMRQQNVFNSGSTGGAVSPMFARPHWQQAITIKSNEK